MKRLKYRWVPVPIDYLGIPPSKHEEEPTPSSTRFIDWVGKVIVLFVFASSVIGGIYFYLVSRSALRAADTAETRQHLAEERGDSLSTAFVHSQQSEANLRLIIQRSASAQDSLQQIEGKLQENVSRVNDSLAITRMLYHNLVQDNLRMVDRYRTDRQRWADSLNRARNALAYKKFAQQVAFYAPSEYRQNYLLRRTAVASDPLKQKALQAASMAVLPEVPDWLKTWGKKDLQAFFASTTLASCCALAWALWHMGRQQKGRFRPGRRHH